MAAVQLLEPRSLLSALPVDSTAAADTPVTAADTDLPRQAVVRLTSTGANAARFEDTSIVPLNDVAEQQVAFTISGPSEIGEGESAVYSIGCDGTLADGETASVKVGLLLDETSPVDFIGTLGSALSDAELAANGVTVRGTTVEFTGGAGHDTTFSFALGLRDDSTGEQLESFRVEIGQSAASSGWAALHTATATTTIRDNDGRIVFALTQDSQEPVSENAGQRAATYTVRYSGRLADGETAGVDVVHHLHDTTDNDYTEDLALALQNAVASAAGVTLDGTRVLFHGGSDSRTSLTFSLTIDNDDAVEGPESFQILLSHADTSIGGLATVDATARFVTSTITDNDNLIEFSLTGSESVTEDPSDDDLNLATYSVNYTGRLFPGESASVDVVHLLQNTTHSDYTAGLQAAVYAAANEHEHITFDGTTLTFHRPTDPNVIPVTALTFSIGIADDGLAEAAESFAVELRNTATTTGGIATTTQSSVSTSIISNNPLLSIGKQHVTSLAEDAALSADLHVADLSIDDSPGVTRLTLAGNDADLFRLVGHTLFLRSGVQPDYESNSSLDVTVRIDDPLLADNSAAGVDLSIDVHDVTLAAFDDVLEVGNSSRGEAVELDLLANDFCDAASGLTIVSITGATAGSIRIQSGNGVNDTATYIAGYGFAGSEHFTYVVEDAAGNQATAQVALTVFTTSDANRAPVVDTIHVSTTSGTPKTFRLFDTLFDPDGDSLTLVSLGEPQHGSLTPSTADDGTTQYTYSPHSDFSGTDSITFAVADEHGWTVASTIQVTVINSPPMAVPDAYTVESGTVLTADSQDRLSRQRSVLVNDIDADNGDLSAQLVTSTQHGTLLFSADGTFTYAPDESFIGEDSFTYRINDEHTSSTAQAVTVHVTATGDGQGTKNGIVRRHVPDPPENDPALGEVTTTRGGSPWGTFSIDPTRHFAAPTTAGTFTGETPAQTKQTETVSDDGVVLTNTVAAGENGTSTVEINPDGSWHYHESYTSSWNVVSNGSDGSVTQVSGHYTYTLSASGDSRFSTWTFTGIRMSHASGSYQTSIGSGNQAGTTTTTWTQSTMARQDAGNFTSLETGLATGSQLQSFIKTLNYSGSGSWDDDIQGGSMSRSLHNSGRQVETSMLSSQYSASAGGWISTGSGSSTATGQDQSGWSGHGSYTLSSLSDAGVQSTTSGQVSESGSDEVRRSINTTYTLGAGGWTMISGDGRVSVSGDSDRSTVTSGSWNDSVEGGSISGSSQGRSEDSARYQATIRLKGLDGTWTSTGRGSRSGNGSSEQSSDGSGSSTVSTSVEGGTATSTTMTSQSSESASNYSFQTQFALTTDGTWSITGGSSSSSGNSEGSSTGTSSGSYTRILGEDVNNPEGRTSGSSQGSNAHESTSRYQTSASYANGGWQRTGSYETAEQSEIAHSFTGSGSYSRTGQFDGDIEVSMTGTINENGSSEEQSQFQTSGAMDQGSWIQISGNSSTHGKSEDSIERQGNGQWKQSVAGGSVSGSADEQETTDSSSDFSISSRWTDGAWINSGSRQDSRSTAGNSSYESDQQASRARVQQNNQHGTSTIQYELQQSGEEQFEDRSTASSLLDADGQWQLISGDAFTARAGSAHSKSSGEGSYTQLVSGGTINGKVTNDETIRDSEFDFTISSSVVNGGWQTVSSQRHDKASGTTSYDAEGTGSYSHSHSSGAHSTTFRGSTEQKTHSESTTDNSTQSVWTSGEWQTIGGSGTSSGQGEDSLTSTGQGSYSRDVDGGQVSGNSSIERGFVSDYKTNSNSQFSNGAWKRSGSRSSHTEHYENTAFTGDGTWSRTVDDGEGNSYTESGTVQESTADNSTVTTNSAFRYSSDGGWDQTSGTSLQTDGGHSMLHYSTGGDFDLQIDGETFSGTLTKTWSVGVESYDLTASEEFSGGQWQAPSGSGTRVESGTWTTSIDVSGQQTRGVAGASVIGTLSLTVESAEGSGLIEEFGFDDQGRLINTGTAETACEGSHATSGFSGTGDYSRSIKDGAGMLFGSVDYSSESSLHTSFDYRADWKDDGTTDISGSATVTGDSSETLSRSGSGDYTLGDFSGTVNESSDQTVTQFTTVTYALHHDYGLWLPESGSGSTSNAGSSTWSASGSGSDDGSSTHESSTTRISLGGLSVDYREPNRDLVDRGLSGRGTQTTTTSFETSYSQSESADSSFSNSTSSRLVDGTWVTDSDSSSSQSGQFSATTETTRNVSSSLEWDNSSKKGFTTGTFETSTEDTRLLSETVDYSRTSSSASKDGQQTRDSSSTFNAQVSADFTSSTDRSLQRTFGRRGVEGQENSSASNQFSEQYVAWYASSDGQTDYGKRSTGDAQYELSIDASTSDRRHQRSLSYTGFTNSNSALEAEWSQESGGPLTGGITQDDRFREIGFDGTSVIDVTSYQDSDVETSTAVRTTILGMDRKSGWAPEDLPGRRTDLPSATHPGLAGPASPDGEVSSIGYDPPQGLEPEETIKEPVGGCESVIWAGIEGFVHGAVVTGGKALVNSAADTVGGLVSLGQWDPPDVIPVDPNTDLGYEGAAIAARIGTEAGLAAVTMGAACATRVGAAVNALDTAGAVVSTGQGVADIAENGLTAQNGLQVAMGAVGSSGILRRCFARDTVVATPNGPRPIGGIQPGEQVLAYDFEAGTWNIRRVLERHDNNYIGPLITITTEQGAVRTTMYHPFWVIDGEELSDRRAPRELQPHESEGLSLPGRWVNSHELQAGDVVLSQDGQELPVLKLEQEYQELFPVSNLTIEQDQNFAVGPDAVLVHNTGGCGSGGGSAPKPGNIAENPSKLTRYGKGAESAEELAEQARAAEKIVGVHGVSTRLNTSRRGKKAFLDHVKRHFRVHQTGNDPKHYTVELPNPVTQEIADLFNKLFPPKNL